MLLTSLVKSMPGVRLSSMLVQCTSMLLVSRILLLSWGPIGSHDSGPFRSPCRALWHCFPHPQPYMLTPAAQPLATQHAVLALASVIAFLRTLCPSASTAAPCWRCQSCMIVLSDSNTHTPTHRRLFLHTCQQSALPCARARAR